MSGSSVIKDNSCILKDFDGNKFTSGVVFVLDSEVLQGFGLGLFRPVDIQPELEVKGETTDCIQACIVILLVVMYNGAFPSILGGVAENLAEK